MQYLLDTCVLSELVKKTPSAHVIRWLRRQNEQHLYISALTIGEIAKGIERLPNSAKKATLSAWLEKDLLNRFEGRIFDVDHEVAAAWGRLAGESEGKRKTLSPIDGLISATALVHDCILVTRNTGDMPIAPTNLLNPWVE